MKSPWKTSVKILPYYIFSISKLKLILGKCNNTWTVTAAENCPEKDSSHDFPSVWMDEKTDRWTDSNYMTPSGIIQQQHWQLTHESSSSNSKAVGNSVVSPSMTVSRFFDCRVGCLLPSAGFSADSLLVPSSCTPTSVWSENVCQTNMFITTSVCSFYIFV